MKTSEAINTLLNHTNEEGKNTPKEVTKAMIHLFGLEQKKEVEEFAWGKTTAQKMNEMEKEIERYRKEFADVKDAILHYCTFNQTINPKWIKQYNNTLDKIKNLTGTMP